MKSLAPRRLNSVEEDNKRKRREHLLKMKLMRAEHALHMKHAKQMHELEYASKKAKLELLKLKIVAGKKPISKMGNFFLF